MKLKSLKDIHIVVKMNYFGRLLICTVEIMLLYSVFYHHKEPLPYWLAILGLYLFWPTGAFLVSAYSKDQKKTEIKHMAVEAIISGWLLAMMKFDLWATFAYICLTILFHTMIGGPKFFFKAICLITVSAALCIYFLPGFAVLPHSSPLTIAISITLILVAIAFIGLSAYRANKGLSNQRRELKDKQEQIISSLKYARTIQNSLMAVPESIYMELPNSFIIWEPRDIVGGDIYYAHFSDNEFILCVIDCTGHGVPGALLSMVAASILQRIVRAEKIRTPSEILKRLNLIVKLTLYQDSLNTVSDDGMDVGICVVNKLTRRLTYAGARIPLLIIKNGRSEIIKGNKPSIGYRFSDPEYQYTDHDIDIEKGTSFYLFSDGIISQTGGKNERMFGTKRLRNLLETNSKKSFNQQKTAILESLNEFQSTFQRKDDITLVGFSLDASECQAEQS